MTDLNIAWWNLENLFDHETASRPAALIIYLKNELKGWSTSLRDKKIRQLANIIQLMFDDDGPDLLGVCEKEACSVRIQQVLVNANSHKACKSWSPTTADSIIFVSHSAAWFRRRLALCISKSCS